MHLFYWLIFLKFPRTYFRNINWNTNIVVYIVFVLLPWSLIKFRGWITWTLLPWTTFKLYKGLPASPRQFASDHEKPLPQLEKCSFENCSTLLEWYIICLRSNETHAYFWHRSQTNVRTLQLSIVLCNAISEPASSD